MIDSTHEVKDLWKGLKLKMSQELQLTHFVLKQFEKPIAQRISKDNLFEIAQSLSSRNK